MDDLSVAEEQLIELIRSKVRILVEHQGDTWHIAYGPKDQTRTAVGFGGTFAQAWAAARAEAKEPHLTVVPKE